MTAGLDQETLVALFRARADALGVAVIETTTSEEAAVRIAGEVPASSILVTGELASAAPDLIGHLGRHQVQCQVVRDPIESRDAPVGMSLAHLAIAATGSVLLAEPTLADRSVGMLVATQIVICPVERLVPDLGEAAGVLRSVAVQPGGGYATLVSGPSRTADIERQLTVGVQGPARVIVALVGTLS